MATDAAINKMSRTASIRTRRPRLQKKAEARRRPPAKTAKIIAPPVLPKGALETILKHTKIAAWEGLAQPLRVDRISPAHLPFLLGLRSPGQSSVVWTEIIHPLDKLRVAKFFDDVRAAALPTFLDYRVIDFHGSVSWVRHGVDETFSTTEGLAAKGWIEDIQREKEFQLESLRVSEREQQRIGQDLHDDLCQVLAGLSCLMRVFEGRIATKAPEEVGHLKELNQQIVDAMLRTRALTHGLFPGKVQVSDIRGALLELVSQVRARFPVEIQAKFEGRFPKHSSEQIIQIYRLVQEAISNAMKHGRAKEIRVRLEAQPQMMELTVTDNGSGLGTSETVEPGVGLSIMSYRAAALGGEVAVQNAATTGVSVRLRYPFASA